MSEIPPNTAWQRAATFAAHHHASQFRPDGHTPYLAHPVRVALTVSVLFQCQDPDVIAAALLHDVLEKSGATCDELEAQCGSRVAAMVAKLSKDHRLPHDEAEGAYFAQLRSADWQTRLIKLADVYDNLCDAGAEWGDRRKKAEKALGLIVEPEEPMLRAGRILREAIATPPKHQL